jgi:hypothetical protein
MIYSYAKRRDNRERGSGPVAGMSQKNRLSNAVHLLSASTYSSADSPTSFDALPQKPLTADSVYGREIS